MFKKSDKKLVSQALKGNQSAWVDLVKRYEKLVYHYGVRMLPSPDDAFDLLQDTFSSVFRSLKDWNQDDKFKPWLMTIAHRRCVEFYRRRHIDVLDNELQTDLIDESTFGQPEPELSDQQQEAALVKAIRALPLAQRMVVELKFFQHLTTRAIATQLQESENTIKSRLYSGVEKLKRELEVING
ncbi:MULTISPECIES: RNA polymerase sigma factor [Idiomarina]|uniref:Sigma-70 family RNA polymerase sigma factor n=2 Tax=Idiomarina baltica TaxID=190892 RepID=A0A348WQ27_9GAMM|nr:MULTISPECIES: sigma-70 family RNA polymerase sigma factor [Idiomarina]MAF75770.1 sigma-70 family RNA polymerase sigma factor [Idiomarinaceae bacterium]MEC8925752.1 sigma-70 family RNA polymerase sigma factor [Pseudomonadota bacterium]EAQ32327.1 RNA polymerase sigma factor, sigma-70 family protein [Idiomarina baltica OS145]MBL74766.1 sigma-70 family RNA polymerase sigma factor [Idiomarinaceae bacterium]MBR38248.1 sigma-70 family RNA polymerase sigma factor [Idiomarina sp.]